MSGEKKGAAEATKASGAADAQSRQRSTIGFPYMDLPHAIEFAEAIHSNVGLGECDDDQLAAWTNQSAKSSGFRIQIGNARMFGVISSDSGKYKIEEFGRMIVDPSQARDGKARAFLNVPLYKAVFDKYRGGVLPPAAALERDMVALGVAEKQKDKARQVFERSAMQAGFFEHGKNKLVMPGVAVGRGEIPSSQASEDKSDQNGNSSGGGGGPTGIDPIIMGLLKRLPKSGYVWPETDRKLWLELLEGSFKLIYKEKDVDVPPHVSTGKKMVSAGKKLAEGWEDDEAAN